MEGRIRHIISGNSGFLTNSKYNVKVTLKQSSGKFFVRFRVKYQVSKELLLWSVIKVDNNEALSKVQAFLNFLEHDFCKENNL